ncbi:hypothetical protein MMC28_010693 [Mycoblastus sanguinarius]|nr:hypothetical protein [Mycoblastus sanguinarius]
MPGFRNLNQAQLLSDQLYYPDSLDAQQWLVYYISRPLVGSYEPIKITPAVLPSILKNTTPLADITSNASAGQGESASSSSVNKKDVKTFNDLLNSFPMIARQMQPGLEKVFKDFNKDVQGRPSALSRRPSNGSRRSSTASTHSQSSGSIHSRYSNGHPKLPSVVTLRVDEEDQIRRTLESAVTAAIDLFQQVDKQQLSLLGATTDLTGPMVERLIERYVTEQLHDSSLFPVVCNSRKLEDLELESRIHCLQYIDVAQVGIAIGDGRQGKEQLMNRLAKGVEEFWKLGVAGSPQQMMDILLSTLKLVTTNQPAHSQLWATSGQIRELAESEKAPSAMTMNADTLVSLLLVVVIRSQVRHLQARLAYMRNFVFIDDVESGEIGYALSTFEAVLSYLASDSGGLRKASRRNKRLWQATKRGELREIKAILEPNAIEGDGLALRDEADEEAIVDDGDNLQNSHFMRKENRATSSSGGSSTAIEDGYTSEGSTLAHVFPFQAATPPCKGKRVSMDMRSLSNSSEYSFVSRTTTIDSKCSGIEGDTSIETLTQTQDVEGNSILMMAIEARQSEALAYLLSLEEFFSATSILEDSNKEGTTLLSAAVQLGHTELIELLLRRVFATRERSDALKYFSKADNRGRTVAHYLFNAPHLIPRFCDILPWRRKDKNGQTPLLALCRSYDHPNYSEMVNDALQFATHEQADGQPLHLDDHVDSKGNTLLHVINDPSTAIRILCHCDSDANATNDKRFTPLMVASKYGRIDMVRALFGDKRVDVLAKEQRGMTAVELAKDDEIRNRIDDMVLVSNVPAADGRVTAVVRSFFVEDGSIRLIIKSAVRNDNGMIGVTTCRRSLTDFENLAKWLSVEHPASWLPSIFNFRSPYQIPSRPSRSVLQDIQIRLDAFLKIMLAHSTFSTHELLWEFILFPEIQPDMMAERSRKKAEIRAENIRDDYEPVEDVSDVSSFVEHARESIRGVSHSTKSVIRRATGFRVGTSSMSLAMRELLFSESIANQCSDFSLALDLCARSLTTLSYLPTAHITAFSRFATCCQMLPSDPYKLFHQDMQAISSTILAILSSLARPHSLINSLVNIQKAIDRHESSLRRSDRWPLGLLDETRKGIHADAQEKAGKSREELRNVGCELSYTQQTVASELAGWQELHAKLGKRAIRTLAGRMVVREKDRLEGMRRAVRGAVGLRKG